MIPDQLPARFVLGLLRSDELSADAPDLFARAMAELRIPLPSREEALHELSVEWCRDYLEARGARPWIAETWSLLGEFQPEHPYFKALILADVAGDPSAPVRQDAEAKLRALCRRMILEHGGN